MTIRGRLKLDYIRCFFKLPHFSRNDLERGQVLLLSVLLLTVVLTVAMSLLTRSIVNVKLSVEEDQSLKALAAAEAGIEKALITSSYTASGILSNNAEYSTTYTQVSGVSILLNNGKLVLKDTGTDIWLSDYSDDTNLIYSNPWSGTLNIYWGTASDTCNVSESVNTMAALEIIVLTGNRNNPSASRYVFDPCGSRRLGNKFQIPQAGGVVGNKNFAYSARITLAAPGLFARVIPLYAHAYIGVQGTPVLPAQGTLIRSTGIAGDVARTVTVLKDNPIIPTEFIVYTFLWPR